MTDKYDTKFFWIKYQGDWRIAEKRWCNRWFICGDDGIIVPQEIGNEIFHTA